MENIVSANGTIDLLATSDGPYVLIVAGVHGDEFEPMIALMELVTQIKTRLKRGKVRIVPLTNKSAYENGKRCGEDGLDLARVCPGGGASSPTLKDANRVSESIKECDYLIDLHTGGQLFDIYPLTGYMLHSKTDVLDTQRAMAHAFGLPLIWGTAPNAEGRTLSVARDYEVPAIYTEYGGPGPVRLHVVEAFQKGCLNVLRLFNMLDNNDLIHTKAEYLVEENEPESGYLQGKMLSPFDGVFVAAVEVGSLVKKGQLWGVVHDVKAMQRHEVFTDTDGLVLFIRCFPRTKKGDSLGGILAV